MKYRMVAVDLDDSLLGDDLKISEVNKKAILEASNEGLIVTIATGRMYKSALPYIEQLKLDVPVITYQGGLIKSALSQEVLYHCPVPLNIAMEIVKKSSSDKAHLQIYIDDEYYVQEYNEFSEMYRLNVGVTGIAVGPLDQILTKAPTKLLIIDNPDRVLEMRGEYDSLFGGLLQITISKPNYLEITHKDATKGKALEYLAKMLNIDKSEIIAIGDSYNDISMIEYAGLGVVMGNACEEVKRRADYVTSTNNENGVAEVINKFIFGGR